MSKYKQIAKYSCAVVSVIAIILASPDRKIRTGEAGLMLIGNAEGCMQYPYQCPADVLTVGIGSTEASGEKIEKRIYSLEEIAKRWERDIATAENCVNRYGNGFNMPQNAFEAMTSLTFNVGCANMKRSTLFRLANNGYKPAMCDEFRKWKYAGGKVLQGLVKRREKERELCLRSFGDTAQ